MVGRLPVTGRTKLYFFRAWTRGSFRPGASLLETLQQLQDLAFPVNRLCCYDPVNRFHIMFANEACGFGITVA